MKVKFGEGKTKYGPGISISLSGDEVASAIDLWLYAKKVYVNGARTITVNGKLCSEGSVYIDPSGSVLYKGIRLTGRGVKE